MNTPRPASPASTRSNAASAHLQIAYQLDALLHTMRAVVRAEEQLCSLMHSIERERVLPARARRELLHLLQDLPTDICDADRHAILDSLGAAVSSPTRTVPQSATQSAQTARRTARPPARKPSRPSAPGQSGLAKSSRRATAPPARKTTPRKAATPKATRKRA